MKQKFLLFFLSILLSLSILACSHIPGEQATIENTNSEEIITVVDQLNRSITLEKKPERIVSGYYISTSALIALGLEDKLVGIEAKAETRPIYSLAAPELLSLPNVGTAKEFDLEGCVSLKPDLVILPIRLKEQIGILEDLGVTVIGVNPENQILLEEMINLIGKITGTEDKAKELLQYYEEREKELKAIHSGVEEKPRVYLAGNSNLLSTATKNMYQNDLIESAGAINVAGHIDDTYWATISYEQLIQYNPDYIIIVPEAKYSIDTVLNDKNISQVTAILKGNVYQMPKNFEAWDSPVPSGILGKIWLTSILYQENYPYAKFVDEVTNFYGKFYGFEVDKEVLIANAQQ